MHVCVRTGAGYTKESKQFPLKCGDENTCTSISLLFSQDSPEKLCDIQMFIRALLYKRSDNFYVRARITRKCIIVLSNIIHLKVSF